MLTQALTNLISYRTQLLMNYLKHALKRLMFLAKEKNVDITDFYLS